MIIIKITNVSCNNKRVPGKCFVLGSPRKRTNEIRQMYHRKLLVNFNMCYVAECVHNILKTIFTKHDIIIRTVFKVLAN